MRNLNDGVKPLSHPAVYILCHWLFPILAPLCHWLHWPQEGQRKEQYQKKYIYILYRRTGKQAC